MPVAPLNMLPQVCTYLICFQYNNMFVLDYYCSQSVSAAAVYGHICISNTLMLCFLDPLRHFVIHLDMWHRLGLFSSKETPYFLHLESPISMVHVIFLGLALKTKSQARIIGWLTIQIWGKNIPSGNLTQELCIHCSKKKNIVNTA